MTDILPIDPLHVQILHLEPDEAERRLRAMLAEMQERHRMEAKPLIDALVHYAQCRASPLLLLRSDP